MSDLSAAAPAPAPAESMPAQPPRRGLLERIGDRLNPILVREVHQALGGKAFVVTAALALLAITIIALVVASKDEVSPRDGAEAFLNTLHVLIPILFFIVPFQAFLSMRAEVGGGTVEHLLMSRLSPAGIVRGKLMATTVQFAIYLAIFSPLLAMTFLLRGVDVPTIAVMVTLAFIVALACSALGIACGALCRWKALFKVVPFAIMLIGLGWLTGGAIEVVDEIVRDMRRVLAADQFMHWFTSIVTVPIVATLLFGMIGSSALAHPYENRSTKFRIFSIGFVLLAFGWTIHNYKRMAPAGVRRYFDLGDQLLFAGAMCALALCLFPFFAATEAQALSPRVRRHVPRNPLLAMLVAPLLPGCGRGLVFALGLSGLVVVGVWLLPSVYDEAPADGWAWMSLIAAWLYVIFFSAVGCRVRSALSDAESRNWWARATVPILLLAGTLLPLLASVVAGRSVMRSWSPLHLLNPFYTLDRIRLNESEIMGWLVGFTLLAVLLNVVVMVRGIREVAAASRDRRARAP